MEIWNDINLKIEPLNENAGSVFKEVVSHLDNYWVSAGTALGLYRDKDLIEGDTDLDFAFIGYDGVLQQIKKIPDFKKVRSIIHEGKFMQLCFMKDGVLIDFYFHYPEDDNYVNYSESGKQIMPKRIYDKTQEIETKYGKVKFVKDIEEYLTIRYEDWKTKSNNKPKFEKI